MPNNVLPRCQQVIKDAIQNSKNAKAEFYRGRKMDFTQKIYFGSVDRFEITELRIRSIL